MANGTVGGRYQVLREIGRGGTATVYLCNDSKHHREVALKVLRPDLAALVGAERFLREIEITAALNHPHVLPLLDSGVDAAVLYYVMPYVAGGSLRVLLNGGTVPLDAVVRITGDVASALDYAHERGVIHRDIKPENILFNQGVPVVADFGIARAVSGVAAGRLTVTGLSVGTLGYMSPEQALGTSELDARSDVYSLGSVVYELLAGATPASWPGADDVVLGRFAELPAEHRARLDALPGRVEQVLVKALALRAAHRYARAGELASALAAASQRTAAFTDEQVRQLLQRAAELQAGAPELLPEPALTIGAVEQIAAQVGIPPVHVREAARALARPPAPAVQAGLGAVVPGTATAHQVPAQQPKWDRLVATAVASGEASEAAFPAMVAEIERRLGIVGHASVIGGTLTWSPATQSDASRKVVVQVVVREGQTAVRIQENLELEGIRKMAIPAGILGGMGFGGVIAGILGAGEPGAPILAIMFAGLGAFIGIRAVISTDSMNRQPVLEELATSLAAMAATGREQAALVPAAPPGIQPG